METNKKGGANRSEVLSMACFAFMTHTNSPEIALRFTGGPSSPRSVLAVQTLVLWAVYCGIAVCGYMSFLEDTKQLGFFLDVWMILELLEMFSQSWMMGKSVVQTTFDAKLLNTMV